MVGGPPPEEEDPTWSSSVHCIGGSSLRTRHYATKELPGRATFTQWRTCFRLLRISLIMLDAARLAALHGYEMAVERLSWTYPTAWHLIYAADEVLFPIQQTALQNHDRHSRRKSPTRRFRPEHGSHGTQKTPAEQFASAPCKGVYPRFLQS